MTAKCIYNQQICPSLTGDWCIANTARIVWLERGDVYRGDLYVGRKKVGTFTAHRDPHPYETYQLNEGYDWVLAFVPR